MANLKEIVGLKTNQDHETLVTEGSVQYENDTVIFDDSAIYVTQSEERDSSDQNYSKEEIDIMLDAINDYLVSLVDRLSEKTNSTGAVVSGTFDFKDTDNNISINYSGIRIVSENGGDFTIGDTALNGELRISSVDASKDFGIYNFNTISLNASKVVVPDVVIS